MPLPRQILDFGNHIIGTVQVLRAYIAGMATAGTAKTFPAFVAEHDATIKSVTWVPSAAVTGVDTNNFALAVRNLGTDGLGTTAVTATKTYAAGTNSVANVPEELTLSATEANLDVAKGQVIALVRTVNGTGLAMPDGVLQVEYDPR